MISKEDFVNRLKKDDWHDGTLEEGDICAIWIDGIAVYAMVVELEPLNVDYWFNVKLAVFDRVPPYPAEWKLHWDHLNQQEFTMNGATVIIIPLAITTALDLPDKIGKQDWNEFINGDKGDDPKDDAGS